MEEEMTLSDFQEAFEDLAQYGSAVWEQGFDPNSDCNANALRYFRQWLARHRDMFEDSNERLSELASYMDEE
jgi:hypothetical protein